MILGKTVSLTADEVMRVENNWTAETEKRGTTISDSAWGATAGTLTGASLSGSAASVLLSNASNGYLLNTVTLANGETLVNKRKIHARGSPD